MQKNKETVKSGYARVKADETLTIINANKEFIDIFGMDILPVKSEERDIKLGEFIGIVNVPKVQREINNKKNVNFELTIEKDQKHIMLQFVYTAEEDIEAHRIFAIVASDVTDLVKMNDTYEQKKDELSYIYDTAVKATAYVKRDEEFTVISATESFYKMLGYTQSEYEKTLKNQITRIIYVPDKENLLREIKLNDKKYIISKDVRMIKMDGNLIWVNMKIIYVETKIGNNKKKPVYFCVFTDIDDIKKTEIEYNKQSWFMELISESMAGGTKITYDDKKKTFAYVGKDLLNFLGYSEDDFMTATNGNMQDMIYEEDVDEALEVMNQWFMDGNYYEIEYRVKRKDGSLIWVLDKGNKITNENGEKVCVSLIVDMDNTRKIIDKLEHSNNEMKKLQNSIPGSLGKVVLLKEYMYVLSGNDSFYEVLGIDINEHKHKYKIDYSAVNFNEQVIHETVLTNQETFYHEYHDKKTNKWYMINGTNSGEMYEEKYPVYFVTIIDISLQKESIYQVQVSQEKYQIISELSEDIVFEYDCHTDIMVYSDKYKQVFGWENICCNVREMLSDKQFNRDRIFIDYTEMFETLFNGGDRYNGEVYLTDCNGEKKWYSITATGMKSGNGEIFKIIGALRNIDKQKREQQKLFDQSRVDSMTKLLNKMATEEEINKKIQEVQPGNIGVLMMIDIDNFKTVNDVQGHLVGDSVITKIAGMLKRTFRSEDVIGRVGGDEFQVYMSNVLDSKVAYEKAEHICKTVKKLFENSELEGKVTVSIGAVCVDKPVKYKEIYQKADIALYSAKENGKDRYEIFGQISKVERILQKKEVVTEESVNINNNLVINTIDILFSKKRMEDNINNVFEYIGYAFQIDKIAIYELNKEKTLYSTRFEWVNGAEKIEKREEQTIPAQNFVVLTGGMNQDVYYCGDINDLPEGQRIYFAQRGIVSLLQCNMVFEGKIVGYINFCEEGFKKVWNQQEIATLVVIAKLVSEFVIRGRNGVVLQKENKEKKFAIAMRESCEYLLDINVANGNYDLYIPEKDGLNSYLNRGNYDDWLIEEVVPDIAPEYANQFMDTFLMPTMMRRFASGTTEITMDYLSYKDGVPKWFRRTAVMITNDDRTRSIVIYINNIDEYKRREEEKEYIEKQILRNHLAIQNSYEAILEIEILSCKAKLAFHHDDFDIDFNVEDGNIFTELELYKDTHIHPEDMITFSEFYKYSNVVEFYKSDESKISAEYRRRNTDGTYSWVNATFARIVDNKRIDKVVILMIKRIAESKDKGDNKLLGISKYLSDKSKEELQYRAEYDALTGIHNIQTFYEETSAMLDENKDKQYAIIRVDIDKFKLINDLYGFEEGNNVLKHVARVIASVIDNENDTIGRLSGDVFYMCMRFDNIDEITRRIKTVTEKITEYNPKYSISVYFGINVVDDYKVDITVQCDWANLALKTIKGNKMVNYAMYDNKLRKSLLDERKFESEMERALSLNQFEMYLQPQYDIASSKIVAAEALVRWNYPDEGILAPYRFIPIFEKNGFIVKLDEFIWEEACKTLHKWIESGKEPIPISVNLSRIHIYDNELCDKLINLTAKYNVPHHLLELELTESVYFDDADTLNRILRKLKNLGFIIAMDDFGSAYSSLNMLENIPIDILKLDRELLQKADNSEQGQTIVKYIVAMAKQLKLKVVAEGVENVDQAVLLLKSSCYIAQGFFYSKPIPLDKFENIAYNKRTMMKIDKKIKDYLNRKKDYANIVNEKSDRKNREELLNSVATFDEVDAMRHYYTDIIDKYRALIIKTNNLLIEVDNNSGKVKRYDNFDMNLLFEDYEPKKYKDFVAYVTERCHEEDVDDLRDMLNEENLQNLIDDKRSDEVITVRVRNNNEEYEKLQISIIVVDNGKGKLKNTLIHILRLK